MVDAWLLFGCSFACFGCAYMKWDGHRGAQLARMKAPHTDDHLPGLIEHAIEANLVLSGVLSSHVDRG
jgi:hypothetical protein